MRLWLWVCGLILLVTVIAASAGEPTPLTIPAATVAECDAAGGCLLVPRKALSALVKDAEERGAAKLYKDLHDGARAGRGACWRPA